MDLTYSPKKMCGRAEDKDRIQMGAYSSGKEFRSLPAAQPFKFKLHKHQNNNQLKKNYKYHKISYLEMEKNYNKSSALAALYSSDMQYLSILASRQFNFKLYYGGHGNHKHQMSIQTGKIFKCHLKSYMKIENTKKSSGTAVWSHAEWNLSVVDRAIPLAVSTALVSTSVEGYVSVVNKATPLAAPTDPISGSVEGYVSAADKIMPLAASYRVTNFHVGLSKPLCLRISHIIWLLFTLMSMSCFSLSLAQISDDTSLASWKHIRTESWMSTTAKEELRGLCDLASSTNLGRLFVGNWDCTNLHPVDHKTVCGWNGVKCDGNGSIVSLSLPKAGIRGTIPASIGNLVVCRELNLAGNRLSSSLPTSIGFLIGLTSLMLSKNLLSSLIPTTVGFLTMLQTFNLAENKLTSSIPSSVGFLSSLVNLNLSRNGLTSSLPSPVGFLTTMTFLGLSKNKLTSSIPTSIGLLKSLTSLMMSSNIFSSIIPTSVGLLVSLVTLGLSYNKLSGSIPTSIGLCTSLESLAISNNILSSRLSSSIGFLTSLKYLLLSHNRLVSSIPSSVGSLTLLEVLGLGTNALTSIIPTNIGLLTSLTVLGMSFNKLSSCIPSSIGFLTRVTALQLSGNKFVCSIPSSIWYMTSLQFLGLWGNAMTSSLPSTMGLLTAMTTLWLSSNALSSVIPTSIGTLKSLQRLGISYTTISGSIPTTVGYLSVLRHIYMSGNSKLTSIIPTSIGLCTSLQLLQLSYNAFTSVIPSSMGHLTKLRHLKVNGNKMTSSIPTTIGFMRSLATLKLTYNKFTSSIPTSMGLLTALTQLNLGGNSFTSSIPSSIWSLTSLNVLLLYGNRLTGTISTSLVFQTNLEYLDLSSNNLQGSLPTGIGLLTNLVGLSLSHNAFSFSIPSTIGLLESMKFLTINGNKLSSSIPAEMKYLTNLLIMKMEDNMLSGLPSMSICQPTLGYISMSGNKLLCVPWCLDDYDWGSGNVSLPRCQDEQDDILFALESSLGVSHALEQVRIQSSSRIIQTSHPCSSFPMMYINDANAFEYVVEMTHFGMNGYVLFCVDPSCNTVIGKYGPILDVYFTLVQNETSLTYETVGVGWLIPFGVTTSLDIKYSSFYIKFQYSGNSCPLVNFAFQCPIVTFGFQLTLTTRLRTAVGWGFEKSLPYPSQVAASRYATGLCQTLWKGVTCEKGRVNSLAVSSLGMHGTVPTSIGLLTALTSLDLSGNLIHGTIVSSIGLLTRLDSLALNSNSFTGTMPSSLVNNTRLYDVSISNNKLTGSVPTLLVSVMPSLQFFALDGNLFSGEIPIELCDVVSKRNLSVSLTTIPGLTCYQELCKGLMQSDQRKYILLDPSLKMCVPTSTPTISPTSTPTSRTVSPASLGLVVVQPLLTTSQTIIISIICPLVFVAALSYVIWRKCFSEKATTKIAKKQTLHCLPIHMLLLKGLGSGKAVSKEHITDVIESNIHTVHCCDGDGNTVLDIISQGKVNQRVYLDSSHVHRILLSCLPNHMRYSEFDDMDGEDRPEARSGNQVLGLQVSMFQRQFSVKVDDIPTKPAKYGWCLAVQHNDDLFVLAVEKILSEHRQHVKALGDIEDDNRRKCKEIAGARIKESIARKLYLAERYQVDEGHAVHKSATSLVYFAIDHGVPIKIEAHETGPYCDKPADSVAPVNSITKRLSRNKNEDGSPSTKPSGNAPPSYEPAGVKPAAPRTPAALRLRMAAKKVVSMKTAVKLPDDHRVALKLMRNKDQFLREVRIREKSDFDPAFVLPIITYYGDPDDENASAEDREVYTAFREDARRKGYGEYPFCIVMEAGRFSLTHVINHDQMAGKDWVRIRDLLRSLTRALQHIHDKGIVHGDLKPLNVLIVGSSIKLIDLDAAANYKKRDVIGKKFSSAYIPPEMFTLDKDTDEVRVRSEDDDEGLLLAHPSQDMWALGCVFYLLATGRTLFHASSDDNLVEQDDFYSVYNWDSRKLSKKLQAVKDKFARNLMSFLLDKDPLKRPNPNRVLGHPFLTGTTPSRLQGEKAEWDVFLSYRVASDSHIASMLYDSLSAKGLTVWWDKKNLLPGQRWEEGFCNGLVKSAYFICLLSRGAIKHADHDNQNIEKLKKGSQIDNVLLEWRLALELQERGMISGVFPVMIGDFDSSTGLYGNYFSQGCHPFGPSTVVDSVETKLSEHLEREGHGLPYKNLVTVREILTTITSNQGGFFQGEATAALNRLTKCIFDMIKPKSEIRRESFHNAVHTVIEDNRQKRILDMKFTIEEMMHENNNLKEYLSDRDQRVAMLEQRNFEHEQRISELVSSQTFGI